MQIIANSLLTKVSATRRAGFTLIELLVVIGIIAVIAGVIGIGFSGGGGTVALQGSQATLSSLVAGARGKAAVANFFAEVGRMQITEFRVLDLMTSERQVAAEVFIDTIASSGRRYRDEEVHLWTFDDAGKVTRFRHYIDTAKHMRAANKE